MPEDSLDQRPLVKLKGRTHPWKPTTPAQITEFKTLWLDLSVPLAAIAKRYKAGERTIQGWRKEFGQLGRDELARTRDRGEIVNSVSATVKADTPARINGTAHIAPVPQSEPSAQGEVLKRPLDPLDVPEIAALLAEVRDDARKMTAISDLRPLRRKLSKLAALASASTPHNWASLHAMAQEQARALLWAEHCEAKLPKAEADARQLRKEAAAQMMRELKSVLTPADQAILAEVIKRGADVLLARQNGRAAESSGPLGAPPPSHNGKVQQRAQPPSYPA